MKTIYECPMSRKVKVLSIIFFLIIVPALGVLFCSVARNPQTLVVGVICLVVLLLAILSAFSLYPQYIIVDEESIGIHTMFHTIRIPFSNIERIDRIQLGSGIRLCGIGGVFGWIGVFKNKQLGVHYAYVTDTSRAFVVFRKQGKPIVFSVADPDEFMPYYLKH